MSSLDKLAFSFLSELHSDGVKNTFESLSNMLEALETKDDPDPIELEMVDTSYQLIEKMNLLSELLKKYVNEGDILIGDKIQSLYEGISLSLFE
jgi:hypothetical protein